MAKVTQADTSKEDSNEQNTTPDQNQPNAPAERGVPYEPLGSYPPGTLRKDY